MYDQKAREDFKLHNKSVVGWILMAGYAYYIRDVGLLTDSCFDGMCKWLYDNYDSIEHKYKHLLTKDMLRAGSTYNLSAYDYPPGIRNCAELLMNKM